MPVAIVNTGTFNTPPATSIYPANASNTGYQNAPGYPGSLTNWPGGGLNNNTTYSYFNFSSSGTAILNASFTSGTSATGVTFVGCRFASNAVGDACVDTVGSHITYSYCTFEPSTVPAGSEPALSNTSSRIANASGYQYGINQTNAGGTITVSHCRFWGFAEGIQFGASTQAAPFVIDHCLFQNPRADGGVDHTDGVGDLNQSTMSFVQLTNNTIVGQGNTNAIAFQGGHYDHFTMTGNYLAGYGFMVFPGTFNFNTQTATNMAFQNNIWGSDVEPGAGPVYTTAPPFSTAGAAAAGNIWSGNKISAAAGTSWMAAGNDGLFWWATDGNPATPSSIVGHVTDYVTP